MGGPPVTRGLLATPKTFAVADIRLCLASLDTPVDLTDESASTKPDDQGAGAWVPSRQERWIVKLALLEIDWIFGFA